MSDGKGRAGYHRPGRAAGPAGRGRPLKSGPPTRAAAWGAAAVTIGLLAGCGGSAAHSATAPHAVACGTARAAAGVLVHIQVRRGHVSCATALSVEKNYARAVASGHAPGNGGGGPVRVGGWTCHGYSTPVVLKTGHASSCVQGSREIMAILPSPA